MNTSAAARAAGSVAIRVVACESTSNHRRRAHRARRSRVIATAAADNHISRKESKHIRARWEQLKSVTEGFVHCCEQGNFRELGEELKKDHPTKK